MRAVRVAQSWPAARAARVNPNGAYLELIGEHPLPQRDCRFLKAAT